MSLNLQEDIAQEVRELRGLIQGVTTDGSVTPPIPGGGPFLPLAGGTLTGPLLLSGDPLVALGAATKQYVDARFSPSALFFPETYGAVGDGTTDDTVAINAAEEACGAAGGGIVWFSKPNYAISAPITVNHAHVSLQSATGSMSHLKPLAGFVGVAAIYITANDCSVKTLGFQPANSDYTLNPACDFIRIESGFRWVIDNVHSFYQNGWCINVQPSPTMTGFSTQVAANTLTRSSAHGLDNTQQVTVSGLTAATTGGIMNGGSYYVVNKTGTTIQLALTSGGAPIDILGSDEAAVVTLTDTTGIGIAGNVPPREGWISSPYSREGKAGCRFQSGTGGGSTWSVSLMMDGPFMDTMLGGPCYEILDCHDIVATNIFGSMNGVGWPAIWLHGEVHVCYLSNVDVGGGATPIMTNSATVLIEGRNSKFPLRVYINGFTFGGNDVGVQVNSGSQINVQGGDIIGNNGSGVVVAGGQDIRLRGIQFDNNNTPPAWVTGHAYVIGDRVFASTHGYIALTNHTSTTGGAHDTPPGNVTDWALSKAYEIDVQSSTARVWASDCDFGSNQVEKAVKCVTPNFLTVMGCSNQTTKGIYETDAPLRVLGTLGGSLVGAPYICIPDDIPPFAGDKYEIFTADGTISLPEAIGDTTTGAITLTLPSVTGLVGQQYLITKRGTGTNLLTILPAGGDDIGGAASVVLTNQYDFVRVEAIGVRWSIVGSTASATSGADKLGLTSTAVKTANYTAAAGDFVPCNTTSATFTVTLPTAPAARTVIGVAIVNGANTLTIAAGGSDVFNKTAGPTTLTLLNALESVVLQYASGIWSQIAGNTPDRLISSASNIVTAATALNAYGTATTNATLRLQSAAGTSGSPTALLSGSRLGKLAFGGYTSGAFTAGLGAINALATENFSATAGGTKLTFETTPNTTIAPVVVLTLGQDGTATFTGAVVLPADPTTNLQAATKQYVDGSAVPQPPCRLGTAAALPTVTYANGTLGVGATLTASATGVLTVDGLTVALNDRVLVKDQASQLQNGIYKCTTAGAVGVAFVLTRATDFDQAAEIPGGYVFVQVGTANLGTGWIVSGTGPFTMGTTAIPFATFAGGSSSGGPFLPLTGGTLSGPLTISAGDLTLSAGSLKAPFSGSSVPTEWEHLAGVTIPQGCLDHFRTRPAPARTVLSADITSGATTLTVPSFRLFPTGGKYVIQIDDEQMLVTSGQGTTTWTIVRAVNGTTAAAHTAGTIITTSGITHIVCIGDSITAGEGATAADVDYKDGFPEQLRRIISQPSLGDGYRGLWNNGTYGPTEFTKSGTWTGVTVGGAEDLMPMARTGVPGDFTVASVASATGSSAVYIWTPRDATTIGQVDICWVDSASSGDWSWSTDGGTSWTTVTAAHPATAAFKREPVIISNPTDVRVRAANAAGTSAYFAFAGVIAFENPVTVNTRGIMVHNIGKNTETLANMCRTNASGDDFRLFEGDAASLFPTLAIIEYSNDVGGTLTAWNSAINTIVTRLQSFGCDVLFVSNPEQGTRSATAQADMRAALKTQATTLGFAYLDIYDAWSAKLGAPATYAAANSAGLMSVDYHPSQSGYNDIAARISRLLSFDGGLTNIVPTLIGSGGTSTGALLINGNLNVVTAAFSTVPIRIYSNTAGTQFSFQHARAVTSSRATQIGTILGSLAWSGATSNTPAFAQAVQVVAYAEQAFATTPTGAGGLRISLRAASSSSLTNYWAFDNAGKIWGGNPVTITSSVPSAGNWWIDKSGNASFAGDVTISGTLTATVSVSDVFKIDGSVNVDTAGTLGIMPIRNTGAVGPQFEFQHVHTGPAVTALGDIVGNLLWQGANATTPTFNNMAQIAVVSEQAQGSSVGKAGIRIYTETGGAVVNYWAFDNAGKIWGGNPVTITSSVPSAGNWSIDASGNASFASLPSKWLLGDGTSNPITADFLASSSTASQRWTLFFDTGAALTVGQTGFQLAFRGSYDNSHTPLSMCVVKGAAEGTWSSTSAPGRMELMTTAPSTTSALTRVAIDSAGSVHFIPTITSGLVANSNFAIKNDGSLWIGPTAYTSNQPSAAAATISAAGNAAFAGTLAVTGVATLSAIPVVYVAGASGLTMTRDAGAAVGSSVTLSTILFRGAADASGTIYSGAAIGAATDEAFATSGTHSGSRIFFQTSAIGGAGALVTRFGADSAGQFFVGTNTARNFTVETTGNVAFAGTLIATPSTVQALVAATTISPNATVIHISSTASITLTATPTITAGTDGQILTIVSDNTTASRNITFQSNDTLAGSNLSLNATTFAVGPRGSLSFVYSSTLTRWVQIGSNTANH